MSRFQHIFFDLDHTLWDFNTNSKATLSDLFSKYKKEIGDKVDFETFYFHYSHVNKTLWTLYREDKINQSFLRSRRFPKTFEKFDLDKKNWMDDFSGDYVDYCPTQTRLMDEALNVLNNLKKKYVLHIITNGFDKTQGIKLKASGLEPYFSHVITSEMASAKKPNPVIFEFALKLAGASKEESAYIGDDYVADVMGGMESGLFTIYFNPENKTNPLKVPEIQKLTELDRYF